MYNYLFKYIVVGNSGVGKTSLISRYTWGTFNHLHDSTIGVDFGVKFIKNSTNTIKLHLWDTAGQEKFRSIIRAYYRASAVVLLVFDVTNRQSFEDAKSWIAELHSHGTHYNKIILVGNKCDQESVVTPQEATQFCNDCGIDRYFEVSAKNGTNVAQVFEQPAKMLLEDIENGTITLTSDMCGIKLGPGPHNSLINCCFY